MGGGHGGPFTRAGDSQDFLSDLFREMGWEGAPGDEYGDELCAALLRLLPGSRDHLLVGEATSKETTTLEFIDAFILVLSESEVAVTLMPPRRRHRFFKL